MNITKFDGVILGKLEIEAKKSEVAYKLASCIVHNKKNISEPKCNTSRSKVSSELHPSYHSERRSIDLYYNFRNAKKEKKRTSKKNNNIGILTIRLLKDGSYGNGRPCNNCLKAILDTNIKYCYYSSGIDKEIICENVKDMYSIQSSAAAITYNNIISKKSQTVEEFYLTQLKNISKIFKKENFYFFVEYSLKNIITNLAIYHFEKHCEIYHSGILVIKVQFKN